MTPTTTRLVCWLFAALACAALCDAAHLPSYIKPCSSTDPNFKACALKNARLAAPSLVQGDRKNRVPVLQPLKITELMINQNGLNVRFYDAEVYGLKDAVIEDVNVDFEKKILSYKLQVSQVVFLSNYSVSGRISILPISGQGKANITLDTVNFTQTLKYDLMIKKDGKEYMAFKDDVFDYTTTRIYIKLDNLFNGDKFLGDQMNQFFDENWRDLDHDFGRSAIQGFSVVMAKTVSSILENVPYDEVFPKE